MTSNGFRAVDVPSLDGQTVMVTGANTGLGLEASKVFAERGARVLLACRSQAKATTALRAIESLTPGADIAVVGLDQADLASVRACAEQVAGTEARLDVLVNNAGIMMPPRELTVDGFESQFGVNHLATFALTNLLLPKLAESGAGRVVITSSLAHLSGEIFFDDLTAEQSYAKQDRYQQSKLANLVHMFELDRRLKASGAPVKAVACHPGIATTDLGRHLGVLKFAIPLISPFFNTAAQGAWPTLQAATDPAVQGGEYFGPTHRRETSGPSARAEASGQAQDRELGKRLWNVSVELTSTDLES